MSIVDLSLYDHQFTTHDGQSVDIAGETWWDFHENEWALDEVIVTATESEGDGPNLIDQLTAEDIKRLKNILLHELTERAPTEAERQQHAAEQKYHEHL